jgi:hypothetical protein
MSSRRLRQLGNEETGFPFSTSDVCTSGERKEVIRLIQTVHASDSPTMCEEIIRKTRSFGTDTDAD